MLKYALLGYLNYHDSTGYDLKHEIDQSTGMIWHAKQSQIYTTLKALEKEKLIQSHIEPGEGKPDRRVYQITEEGRIDLKRWLAEPVTELNQLKDSLLLKLFFSGSQPAADLIAQLHLQKILYQEQLTRLDELEAHVANLVQMMPDFRRDFLLWEAIRQYGVSYTRNYLNWIDSTITRLETNFED